MARNYSSPYSPLGVSLAFGLRHLTQAYWDPAGKRFGRAYLTSVDPVRSDGILRRTGGSRSQTLDPQTEFHRLRFVPFRCRYKSTKKKEAKLKNREKERKKGREETGEGESESKKGAGHGYM